MYLVSTNEAVTGHHLPSGVLCLCQFMLIQLNKTLLVETKSLFSPRRLYSETCEHETNLMKVK